MAINLRDKHLEHSIAKIQKDRGDGTATKTARDLLTERLREIELDANRRADRREPATAA